MVTAVVYTIVVVRQQLYFVFVSEEYRSEIAFGFVRAIVEMVVQNSYRVASVSRFRDFVRLVCCVVRVSYTAVRR